jgi:type IV secretory pathway TraG/TraD family ATPase VirD4
MFALFTVQRVLVEIELGLALSLRFPTQPYLRKVQRHTPFAYENKLQKRIKKVPLYLTADVRRLRTASFTAFLISTKKGAPPLSAGTLRYCHEIVRPRLLISVVPEVHRGVNTSPLSSTILCLTRQVRVPLSHSWRPYFGGCVT